LTCDKPVMINQDFAYRLPTYQINYCKPRNHFAHFMLATFLVSVFPQSFLATETSSMRETRTFLVLVYNAVSKCGIYVHCFNI